MRTKICSNCQNGFEKPYNMSAARWLNAQYCSIQCYGEAKRNRVSLNCDYCNTVFFIKACHLDRSKRHFCSMDCRSSFVRDIMPKEEQPRYGTGVSPEEKAKRIKARSILNHYLRDKKIVRPPCEVCGSEHSEAHHDDYDRPLDVKWLCFKHHREHHKQLVETPELLKP